MGRPPRLHPLCELGEVAHAPGEARPAEHGLHHGSDEVPEAAVRAAPTAGALRCSPRDAGCILEAVRRAHEGQLADGLKGQLVVEPSKPLGFVASILSKGIVEAAAIAFAALRTTVVVVVVVVVVVFAAAAFLALAG